MLDNIEKNESRNVWLTHKDSEFYGWTTWPLTIDLKIKIRNGEGGE